MAKNRVGLVPEQLESRQLLSGVISGVVADIFQHVTSAAQHAAVSHTHHHHAHVHRPHPGKGESYDTPENVSDDDLATPPLQPLGSTPINVATSASVVAPSSTGVAGMGYSDTASGSEPPDPGIAVGLNQVVETVNTAIRVFNKAVPSSFSTIEFSKFFTSLSPLKFSDPVVAYDDQANHWMIGILDYSSTKSRFDLAVSKTANATTNPADWEMHQVSMLESNNSIADYPKMGWNNDAIVVSFNMFPNRRFFKQVQVLAVNKAAAEDGNSSTFTSYRSDVSGGTAHFTLTPASMHGSLAGGPMYMVESLNNNTVGVMQMTNVLSSTPKYIETSIPVTASTTPPKAAQPGGSYPIDTVGPRILQADWRNNRLVAAHTIGLSTDALAHGQWFDFSTANSTVKLNQQGIISPTFNGTPVSAFFPTAALDAGGNLGIDYAESGSNEYWSVYATGQLAADAGTGATQPPILIQAGNAVYTGSRGGDYSEIGVDPSDGRTFWLANEYKPSNNFWGTAVGSFTVSVVQPTAPATLTAAAVSTGEVDLNWSDVSGETDYIIERADNGGAFAQIADVGANVTAYSDLSALPSSNTYDYRVWSHNTAGTSATASPVASVPLYNPPDAPANLTAAPVSVAVTQPDQSVVTHASTSQIQLSWSDVANETGFRVQRTKLDASGNPGAYSDVATLPQGTLSYTDSNLTPGSGFSYRLFAVNGTSQSAAAIASATTGAAVIGQGVGLTGQYYGDATFSSLKITRTDPQVNFNWGTGSPGTGVPTDNFTARWTGQVLAPVDEQFTFSARSDDDMRLWIADENDPSHPTLLISIWGRANTSEYAGVPVTLQAGHKYDIQMDYMELTGGASTSLYWQSPSTAKQLIPTSQLFNTYETINGVGTQPASPYTTSVSGDVGTYVS